MAIHYTIEHIRQWAADKGGKCLSKEYWGMDKKVTWMCSKGHTWDSCPYQIHRGQWCPACATARNKYTLEDVIEWAKQKNGICLSKKYIDSHTKLKWQCKEGHIWVAVPYGIKSGKWCPYCAHHVKGTIQEMRKIAKAKDGRCLSKKYISTDLKLKWQCSRGHVWKSTPHSVKNDTWCPYCYGNAKHTLQEMKLIAKKQGGKCLAKRYINKTTKLKWQCAKGHVWQTTPGIIVHQKSWCPVCSKKRMGNRSASRHCIEKMHNIAQQRKGKCLSIKYVNVDTNLKWQCTRGHIWNARPYSIIHCGSWCGKCRNIDKRTRQKEIRE